MNNIVYIANIRIPTEKAHGIQIMKTCEAFARAGAQVSLIVSWRNNKIKDNPFDYYQVEKLFSIKKIFSIDTVFIGRIGFWIQSFSFSLSVLVQAIYNSIKGESIVYYSRDELPLLFLMLIGKKTVWETHRGQINLLTKYVASHTSLIVAISNGLKDLYRLWSKKEILVAPDGVDIEMFNIDGDKDDIKAKLGLPIDKKIVLYTGHLYDWKGANTLAEAESLLDTDILVVFVGGTDTDIKTFKNKYDSANNIKILGRKLHSEIPMYLKAADILIIPNSAKEDISRLYTSPMKLFEYMASGTPIVASDLPSLREILNERNACFFEADNPKSLAISINDLLIDEAKQKQISVQSGRDIINYSWDTRAKNILSSIQNVQENN
jgi:glycosyltransferase involved in cell wall biosynthesis